MQYITDQASAATAVVSGGSQTQVIFIHTDLLGSPQAESNQQGGLN